MAFLEPGDEGHRGTRLEPRSIPRPRSAPPGGPGVIDALVIDGSARQSLVVTRALGRAGLHLATAEALDMCDPRLRAPSFSSCWSGWSRTLPSYHDEPAAYARALLDLVREHPTRVLIPSMDGSIAALRPWRSCFESHDVALALASECALEIANDKERTLAVATRLGIPSPRTVPIAHPKDTLLALAEVGYPAVIKPSRSWVEHDNTATRVVSRVFLNESEALAYVHLLNEIGSSVIVQQWVGGSREAVSLFYAHGRVWGEFAQVAHRMTPVLGGVSVVREGILMPSELRSAAVGLVQALDLEGYCEVEFRRDASGRPLLMEINARLSGSLEVAVRSGVDFPKLLWRWAAGEPLGSTPGYQTGVRMRFLHGDVKWLLENLRSRRQPDSVPPLRAITTFAAAFLHRQAYDYVDRGDLRPAWSAFARDIGIARHKFAKRAIRSVRRSTATPRTHRSMTMSDADVVVIGAGPNGLSVAAHLNEAKIEHRVFGRTMGAWRFNMPAGMILKSEPYASDLSAPSPGFLAGDYCRTVNEEYHQRVTPLSSEQFVGYGTWFARHLVPNVEETDIVSLSQTVGGFLVRTAEGEAVRASRVVVATGVIPFAFVPPELTGLPSDLVSHTSAHTDLSRFGGNDVLVVGRGQSALETAALLHEQGATVKIVVRGDGVWWHAPNPLRPTLRRRMRSPVARLCEGWHCWAYDRMPDAFRLLPEASRIERGLGFLGRPQGSWWLRERVEGRVPTLLGHQIVGSEAAGDRVRLHLRGPEGDVIEEADHIIAGTGFRFDLTRLGYLEPSLRASLRVAAGAPVLNHHLESNVPGLFFTGALAAPSLGPVMRFVAGTHFTGPRVASRLSSSSRRRVGGISRRPQADHNQCSDPDSNEPLDLVAG